MSSVYPSTLLIKAGLTKAGGLMRNQLGSLAGKLLAAQCLIAATAFVVNVLSARALGPASRGELALYLQLCYLLSAIFSCGFDRSYPAVRHSAVPFGRAFLDLGRLLRWPAALLVISGIVISTVAATTGLLADVAVPVVLTVITLGTMGLLSARTGAIVARTATTYLRLVGVVQVLLIGTSVVLVLFAPPDPLLWALAYASSLSLPVALALVLAAYRAGHHEPTRRTDLEAVRRLGYKIMPSTVANIAMLRADRLLLPVLASTGQLGLYIVVATITETLVWPVQSWIDANIPRWRSAALSAGFEPLKIYGRVLLYVLPSCTVVGVLSYLLVVPLFGPEFAGSRQLVLPLIVATGLYALSRVGVGIGLAYNSSRQVLAVSAAGMIVALVGYVALIPRYGALGAAVGSLIGYGMAAVLSLAMTLRDPSKPAPSPTRG